MRELTDRLSRGIIEYYRPEPEISVSSIMLTVKTGMITEGEFTINAVGGSEFVGKVYSTDGRVHIKTPHISGKSAKVIYAADARYVSDDTHIEGFINIVSNGGEYYIPYDIHAVSELISTNVGNIRNMFHFTNLVQTDYDDALKIFLNSEFEETFLGRDLYLRTVYEGLIACANKSVALEEFLIAARKKKRITISLSEEKRKYVNIRETIKDTVVLSRDNWGYVYVEIINESNFIETDKKVITGDDWAGSNYEVSYLINTDGLHEGNNYGRLVFRHGIKYINLEITVSNKKETGHTSYEVKKHIVNLAKKYFDFRLHNIGMNIWADETLKILDRLNDLGYSSYFTKLIQAQACLTSGRESDASRILESVAGTLLENKNGNIEEYCYYLYIRSLQKRDMKFTMEMKQKIKEYYENGHKSDKILWTLLYMDERYAGNETLKLTRIKEQYVHGMRSPLLYYEAAVVFNRQPALLRVLNDFELQTLLFMVKYNCVGERLAARFADIAIMEKGMKNPIFKILSKMYDSYKTTGILEAICSLLIKSSRIGKKYAAWYGLGIENDLKLVGIYEKYLLSVTDMRGEETGGAEYVHDIIFPDKVLGYFAYNTDFAGTRQAFLYANVISNKDKRPDIYKNYRDRIEKYGLQSISEGRTDHNLAVIYKDILRPDMITRDIALQLTGILNTYHIKFNCGGCKSDIKNVIVIHKEFEEHTVVPVINGEAYVIIYAEDTIIIFEDIYGNRYADIPGTTVTKCFELESYLKKCHELMPGETEPCVYFADKYIKYGENDSEASAILQTMLRMEGISGRYKAVINRELIDYYARNYDSELSDAYLAAVDVSDMEVRFRHKVTELLIMRGNYGRALELIRNYGYEGIEPKHILRCASRLIEENEFFHDELFVAMAAYAYGRGKYNDTVLRYLGNFYDGTVKELMRVWEDGKDFGFESRELEEKIICMIMFTGAYDEKSSPVYESYYKKGAKSSVKKAWLIYKAHDYFVMEKIIDERVFEFIEQEYLKGEETDLVCDLAYIRYLSEKPSLSPERKKLAGNLVKKLCDKDIFLSCYAKLGNNIRLPYGAEDKTILEYRTGPESKVFINYIIESGSYDGSDYISCRMKSIYPGVFTFEAILFYGENLVYYITECVDGHEIITGSENISGSGGIYDGEQGDGESRYNLINDIMVCREMGEDSTFAENAKYYEVMKRTADEIFDIM